MASSTETPYELNSMVLCKHTDNLYYEAKIINVFQNKDGETAYRIHYMGWNKRFDENITHKKTFSRFMKHTPQYLEFTRIQKENALAKQKTIAKELRKSAIFEEQRRLEELKKRDLGDFDRKKYVFPEAIKNMLKNFSRPLILPAKTTFDKIMEEYKKEREINRDVTLYKSYPDPLEYIKNNCDYLKNDFNRNALCFVAKDEVQQFLTVFNEKRRSLGAKELTSTEFKGSFKQFNDDLHLEPGYDFSATVGLIHLARFLKKFCDSVDDYPTLFEQEMLPLFTDILMFCERYIPEYL